MSNTDSGKTTFVGGRGRLLAMLNRRPEKPEESGPAEKSETTPNTQSPPISFTGGRGKLLANLRQPSSSSGNQNTPSDDRSTPIEPMPKVGGRGKFLESLKQPKEDQPVRTTTARLAQLRLAHEATSQSHQGSVSVSAFEQCSQIDDSAVESLTQQQHEEEEEEETPVEDKLGRSGTPMTGLSNYIALRVADDKGVFEYEVKFSPNVHDNKLRYDLLKQQSGVIGTTKTFDGVSLCLPILLPEKVTRLTSENKNDHSEVIVTIIFKKQKKFKDCHQLYGTLFNRIMKVLQFVRFGKKDFDPSEPKVVPQHKLEVWPGYVTAVDEYKGGVMVCVDVTHRVLCQETVLEKFAHAYRSSRGNMEEYKSSILKAMVGSIVLTRYNNKTYRIDDIDFDLHPLKTFKKHDREITYADYYKEQYGITIKDLKQPMLIHRDQFTIVGQTEKVERMTGILPEISYCTGLTDEQRSDFKIMRDLAAHTRITPNQRIAALNRFCARVNENKETRDILGNWGLKLEGCPELNYRQLGEENIFFANIQKPFSAGPNADFGKYATNNPLLKVINLTNWMVIYVGKDEKAAKAFVDLMERNSRPMGMSVNRPQLVKLNDDRTETYANALRNNLKADTQMVVCICPTSRDDRYAVIKKICCAENPIPSQVINARTLANDQKNRSIVQKIALQMNCKLGGSLWMIKIPFKNVMICGIDTYHEAKNQSKSVSAFVASLNATFTQWYSKAVLQNKKEELGHGLAFSMQKALEAYKEKNYTLPEQIIIYRDGVGDGQLAMCKNYELVQLKESCKIVDPNYNPKFTFIVVQKRVNTRVYAKAKDGAGNPLPGAVLDQTVTRRNLYDFYLVPQSVRQGTVTPTHFVVVADESNYDPDIIQRLSYKLCFLYYNWPGTVRVPACCQYAHKLATLVGASVKRETSEKLADKLFYL